MKYWNLNLPLLKRSENEQIMDNTIYKILEKIGETIQWIAEFSDDYDLQIRWFMVGVASLLLIQYIL